MKTIRLSFAPGAFPAVYVFRVKGAVDNCAENDYYDARVKRLG